MTEPDLTETTKTETTVRHYDETGALTSETVTVVTRHCKPEDDLPLGMYL